MLKSSEEPLQVLFDFFHVGDQSREFQTLYFAEQLVCLLATLAQVHSLKMSSIVIQGAK